MLPQLFHGVSLNARVSAATSLGHEGQTNLQSAGQSSAALPDCSVSLVSSVKLQACTGVVAYVWQCRTCHMHLQAT